MEVLSVRTVNNARSCILFLTISIFININTASFSSWILDESRTAAEENKLKFHDCGSMKKLISLEKIEIKPDHFKLPQNISVTARLKIVKNISEPIQARIIMYKKIPYFGYRVQMPCVKSFGSCSYSNICEMLEDSKNHEALIAKNTTNACAWVQAFGLPCECPLPKGLYTVEKTSLPLTGSLLPNWIETGRYKAQLEILQNSVLIGCIAISFTIL